MPSVILVGAPSDGWRLGAESRRTPSDSKRTAAGSNPARALATTNTRRRRWAKPKCWASRIRHATARAGPSTRPASDHLRPGGWSSQPEPASFPRKQPKALSAVERTPGTFSQKTMAGCWPRADRTVSIASASSQKVRERLPRASSSDRRRPATLNAWHGVPPHSRSGASISPASTRSGSVTMLPRFCTSGWWCASTAEGNGSISLNQAACQPNGFHATDAASIPLHTLPNLMR